MSVALVHDWFVNRGGAERVALALARTFPDAPMFTGLAHLEDTYPEVASLDLRTSNLQGRIPRGEGFRRHLLRYPKAFAELDATGFDVVLAQTTAFSHHVKTDGCLIAYAYTPPRFLYDPGYDRGMAPLWARPAIPAAFAWLRRRDQAAAKRAHRYIAGSQTGAARLLRAYGVRAQVVTPPVDVSRFRIGPRSEDHWIVVSRLLPHRGVDLAVKTFTELRRPLVVVGDGPMRAELEAMAGETIRFAGSIGDDELVRLYGSARGALVCGVEDFGLVPLEANASGRPVVARGVAGALETVIDGVTGALFRDATVEGVSRAIRQAEALGSDAQMLRAHALRFDEASFAENMRAVVASSEGCLVCARSGRATR